MAIEKTINIDVNSKKATKGIKDLEKGIDGVNKEVKETNKSTQAMSGTLDKATGGAVSKFTAFKGAIGSVTTGFKSLRVAIIATGIGALLIAVAALGQAFTRSEEGQNKFAKILGVIGSVTGNLLDLLADLGENIISVFENPKQALIDFKDAFIENITNRFTSAIDTLGFLGDAIKKVFSGDFTGALEDAKKAGSSYVDSLTGVKNTLDKTAEAVKNFSKEIVDDATAAAKIADQRAAAEKAARNLIVERAQAEQDIARLREKAVQKDKFSAEERIKFLEEAGKISEDLAEKETKVAKLRLEAKLTENALTKSNKDDLNEAAQLEASVIQLETQRLNLQKRLSTELLTARNEEAAAQKAIVAEETKRNEEAGVKETKRLEDIQKIQDDFKAKQKDKEAESQLEKINLEEERKIAELDRLNATNIQKQEVIDYYANLRLENEDAISKASVDITKKENAAKQTALNAYAGALSDISGVLGQETQAGKGIAIASSLVNTYASIAGQLNAFAGVPVPGYAIAQAIATGVVGFANVKKISSVKIPKSKGGGGGASGSAPSGGSASSIPPAFNVVGSSDSNQLADAIGGQSQQPVQAFVVANDVTTAQSLQNNIVEGATIG